MKLNSGVDFDNDYTNNAGEFGQSKDFIYFKLTFISMQEGGENDGSNTDNGNDLDTDVSRAVPDDYDSLDGTSVYGKEERSAMPKWLKTEYADFRER